MITETWLPVPSTGGNLEASSLGRIRRLPRPLIYKDGRKGTLGGGILKGTIAKTGYHVISYSGKQLLAHRLIAEVFLPADPNGTHAYQTVNHKNGNKLDNRPENLEWASHRDNCAHARATGLNKQHGENTNLSKYQNHMIAAIRRVHAEYMPSYKKLAYLFDISEKHAADVVKGRTRTKE